MTCALSFFQREWGSVSVGYAFGNALAICSSSCRCRLVDRCASKSKCF
jgi:hypothetical protein